MASCLGASPCLMYIQLSWFIVDSQSLSNVSFTNAYFVEILRRWWRFTNGPPYIWNSTRTSRFLVWTNQEMATQTLPTQTYLVTTEWQSLPSHNALFRRRKNVHLSSLIWTCQWIWTKNDLATSRSDLYCLRPSSAYQSTDFVGWEIKQNLNPPEGLKFL